MSNQPILDREVWLLWKEAQYENQLFVERSVDPSPLLGNRWFYTENYYVVSGGHAYWLDGKLSRHPATFDSLRRLRFECECLGEFAPEKIPQQRFWEFDLDKFRTVLVSGKALQIDETPSESN